MVYKRYIKKNGKVYGPYYYKNRKENGKVITEYIGTESSVNKKKPLKVFLIIFISLILLFSSFLILRNNLTDFSFNIEDFSLNSIKTMTGFLISEDFNNSNEIDNSESDVIDIEENITEEKNSIVEINETQDKNETIVK
ncbi:unnamed protein product, partial [marine sediment metagenome]